MKEKKKKAILSNYLIVSENNVSEKTLEKLTVINPRYSECIRLGYPPVIKKKDPLRRVVYEPIPPVIKLFHQEHDYIYLPRAIYTEEQINKRGGFIDKRVKGNKISIKDKIKLYAYQQEPVRKFCKNEIDIIYAKPGDGKTIMAIKIISKLKVKTIVLVNTAVLAEQWKQEALKHTDLKPSDIGIAQEGKIRDGKIIVGTVQTLLSYIRYVSRPFQKWAGTIGLLILDEVHIHGALEFQKAGCIFPAYRRLGITASEDRLDKINVQKLHVGQREYWVKRSDRYQTIVKFVCDSSRPPMKGVDVIYTIDKYARSIARNYKMSNFNDVCQWLINLNSRNFLIKRIVELKLLEGRYIAILTHRVAHVEKLGMLLKKRKPILIYGDSKAIDRGRVIIATYSKLKLGFNFPRLDTIIIATPIGKKTDVEQACGRAERTGVKGKKNPEIIYVFDKFVGLSQGIKKKAKLVMIKELGYHVEKKLMEV
jgi:superfamily II DNA or RNA helicase